MARYVYNREGVMGVIGQLETAVTQIKDAKSTIQAGISTIQGARGGEYINIPSADVSKYQDIAEQAIRGIISDLRSKAQMIDEYNSASWLTRASSSVGMAFTKFIEGFFTAGENIIDGFSCLGGMVVGIFSEDWKNAVGEFIATDHVGDFFEGAYNDGILSGIEKYSSFSSESSAASIFKGFGVATGYVAVAYVTGGVGSAIGGGGFATGATIAGQSLAVNATFAGIGGIGSGTQDGLQAGLDYNQAALYGVEKGAIQEGTAYVLGKGVEFVGKGVQKIFGNSADDVASGVVKYKSEKEFIDAVNSGKYNGDVSALRKDFKSSFGDVIRDGSREHELLADAVQVARGKASSMYSTPINTSAAPTPSPTAASAASPTPSPVVSKAPTGPSALGLPSGEKGLGAIANAVNKTAPTVGKNIISRTISTAAVGAEEAYYDIKNSNASASLGESININVEQPKVKSTYVYGSNTSPSIESTPTPDPVPTPTPSPSTPSLGSSSNPNTSTGNSGTSHGNSGTSYGTSGTPIGNPSTPTNTPDEPIVDVPVNEPVHPIYTPDTSISEPIQPDDTPIEPIDESPSFIDNKPNDPIYKHPQTIRNNGNKNSSNGLAKAVASTIIGLGAVGAAGAAGYGVYNKKKRENEDEEEE